MIKSKLNILRVSFVLALGVSCGALAGLAPAAVSAEVQCGSCAPWWLLNAQSFPATLQPGGEGTVAVLAEDVGSGRVTSAAPVVLADRLPVGLTAQSVELATQLSPSGVGNVI